ncbi:hypothetical protein DFH06DRAFT_1317520 [Mycena polygramma]|nr:hypothetical protein DFH06DRAFT_1317520 [Mycena polygramma]
MHNYAERPPDPACHPGTGNSLLDTLGTWAQQDSPHDSLLWLYGSAGMGKSSIAQTFAANCQERGVLGASFFFTRGNVGRGNWQRLFPTLAYQLVVAFPELRDALQQAVECDKLVFGQAMRHQFQKSIATPFEQSPQLTVRPIIVIDGLDECEDHGVQAMLLKLIIERLRAGAFPVRVLLASRPEPHLRELLEADTNFDVCRHLELRRDPSAYADIRRYLGDKFASVRECHTSRGITLDDGWPGQDVIDRLVEKSSGTFIYATTIVRYVDDEYSHPAEQLDSVLTLDPHSTAPLDTLYMQILSTVPNRSMLRRVLHAAVSTRWLDPEDIDVALQLRAGTSRHGTRDCVRASETGAISGDPSGVREPAGNGEVVISARSDEDAQEADVARSRAGKHAHTNRGPAAAAADTGAEAGRSYGKPEHHARLMTGAYPIR